MHRLWHWLEIHRHFFLLSVPLKMGLKLGLVLERSEVAGTDLLSSPQSSIGIHSSRLCFASFAGDVAAGLVACRSPSHIATCLHSSFDISISFLGQLFLFVSCTLFEVRGREPAVAHWTGCQHAPKKQFTSTLSGCDQLQTQGVTADCHCAYLAWPSEPA